MLGPQNRTLSLEGEQMMNVLKQQIQSIQPMLITDKGERQEASGK